MPVILNPAPARPLPDDLLALVSILTPNETEAELLTGVKVEDPSSAARAADRLLARGVQTVIITLGAGRFRGRRRFPRTGPGFQGPAGRHHGSRQRFNGALAVALAEGRSLDQGVRFANAAAAISATRLGAAFGTKAQ